MHLDYCHPCPLRFPVTSSILNGHVEPRLPFYIHVECTRRCIGTIRRSKSTFRVSRSGLADRPAVCHKISIHLLLCSTISRKPAAETRRGIPLPTGITPVCHRKRSEELRVGKEWVSTVRYRG